MQFNAPHPLLPLLLLLHLGLAQCAPSAPGIEVFRNASEGYHTFRIPTLAVTRAGTLLAFAEGRARLGLATPDDADCYGAGASAADWRCTNKDVVLKRSTTQGATWGAAVPLALATAQHFFTNPQPLATAGGAVLVLYMRCLSPSGGGSAFGNCTALLQRSDDDGVSWGSPLEVPPVQSSAGGFGGLQLASGRLVFSPPGSAATGALYSDDGGSQWAWGAPAPGGAGENQLAELSPQQLLMTVRRGNNSRLLFRSSDGGQSWGAGQLQRVTDPNCQASLLAVAPPPPAAPFLLFANPHTSGLLPYALGRQNVTVQRSSDGGGSWAPLLLVDQGPSAYTALARLGGAACGVLYEESADLPVDFRSIRLVRFDCATGALL
jgi:sialidase-1